MFINAGHFIIREDAVDRAVEALRAARPRVLGDEPGCHVYDFGIDIDDPTRINLFEIYDDAEALATHREQAHTKELFGVLGPLLVERDINGYDVADDA